MKAVVAAFNQEKALVEAFSVITNLRMDLFEALVGCRMLQYITLQQRLHPGIMGHCSAAVGAADGAIKLGR